MKQPFENGGDYGFGETLTVIVFMVPPAPPP
jgi:hypothetical protein